MTKPSPLRLASLALTALAIAACGGPASPSATPRPSPSPSTTPAPSPSPGPATVSSAAQAAALVFAADPHFGSLRPTNTDLIGECCSYEAVEAAPGYQVTINIGWGDCEAGCISHHRWTYHVDPDGTITPVSDEGDDDAPLPVAGNGPARVVLHMRAGPTCPVVRNPPEPGCEPRPVTNGGVVVRQASGAEVATTTSDDQGQIVLQLPFGAYYVEPQPVDGLLGTAPPVAFAVVAGESADINIDYDTGIR